MTDDEIMIDVYRQQAECQRRHAENERQAVQLRAINETIQIMFAVQAAQLAGLIYGGMFNPNFCKPTAPGKEANDGHL